MKENVYIVTVTNSLLLSPVVTVFATYGLASEYIKQLPESERFRYDIFIRELRRKL